MTVIIAAQPTRKTRSHPPEIDFPALTGLPLGQVLERAGLITQQQLQLVLETQSPIPGENIQNTLVQQEWVDREIVDFFATRFPKLVLEQHPYSPSYYFKAAGLLDDDRILSILEEQWHTGSSFEEIAIRHGWIREEIANYLSLYFGGDRRHLQPSISHPSVKSKFKRCLDVIGALVGLVITAILFVPIAIAIKLDSPGPILFGQIRVGLQGKQFRIWKFRSMVKDAEFLKQQVDNQAKGLIFKNRNDPRITRVGHFLRRLSLDEFPQFYNVLLSQMSLVGTRPPTLDEVFRYQQHHWKGLDVKPGLTGQWQANGRASLDNFEDIVAMDIIYQKKWSLLYDLYLIWKTVIAVLRREGAH